MTRAALALLFTALTITAQTVTLDNLLSPAFPSDLTAAPAGGAFAVVLNTQGVRNIYVAAPPAYNPRQLTNYSADDGQEITGLTWTPDGRNLLYIRGGAPNRNGEIPNPTSNPNGAARSLFLISIDAGQQPRLIANDASNPQVSPKGDLIAFSSKGQLWLSPIAGGKPEQAFKMRGALGDFQWSPDGSQIACESRRGDHAFIAVYHLANKALTFLDASLDTDTNPVWSPDGRQLAFLRTPAAKREILFAPRRQAQPWSIRIHDLATKQSRQLWQASPGRGSALATGNLPSAGQLYWTATNHITFTWERDGWSHIYSLNPAQSAQQPKQLTAGNFEVETYELTPDKTALIATTNQNDIDRRHLWRITPDGSQPARQITGPAGIQWAGRYASDGKAFAWLASDEQTPATAMIRTGDNSPGKSWMPLPAAFPKSQLAKPQPVIINSPDGLQVPAQLFLPANLKPDEKRPVAIFFHGGSRRQMLLGFHYSPYYHQCYAFQQYLVSQGWISLSVNYRSGIGYGMEFREALDYGATGASEFRDVQGAGLYLRNHPNVDPKRIFVWGGSYGGYLTALALSRAPELFAAGVDIHGVHDWNPVIKNFHPDYNPLAEPDLAQRAFASSPLFSVKGWRAPVLLIHGDDDRNVPFSESVTLIEQLRKQNVDVETLVFPDEVHGFLRHASWLEVWTRSAGFLKRRNQSIP